MPLIPLPCCISITSAPSPLLRHLPPPPRRLLPHVRLSFAVFSTFRHTRGTNVVRHRSGLTRISGSGVRNARHVVCLGILFITYARRCLRDTIRIWISPRRPRRHVHTQSIHSRRHSRGNWTSNHCRPGSLVQRTNVLCSCGQWHVLRLSCTLCHFNHFGLLLYSYLIMNTF